ncbi:hypothetical protein HanPI659440_Chr15g0617451 [Helianthus annuus]|nr:hypothetical protein HanPI659440_Chr15g0617451 [Helianthus annuus]
MQLYVYLVSLKQFLSIFRFNWGLRVREKSERILKLLEEDRSFLKEERYRARKVTSGIKGFGSFTQRSVAKRFTKSRSEIYIKCSHNNDRHDEDEDDNLDFNDHPMNKDEHRDRVPLVST